MTTNESFRAIEEHREQFEKIWWQNPERQNSTSTSWWFVILFPEGEEGYGPRQLMFSIASAAGDEFHVNDTWAPGLDLDRPVGDETDEFNAITVGWSGDEQQVYDRLVAQPATAQLSRDGVIDAWAHQPDGSKRGGKIAASTDRELGLDAHFAGEDGEVQFEAWGDLDSKVSSPIEAMDVDTAVGGTNLVAWRRMQFEGEFDLPDTDGTESLDGLCYFQRVCMDVPLFPWKWVWAFFPDGTAFSVLVPYVGPQLFRSGYRFFSSNTLERATIPVRQTGLWDWGDRERLVEFDSVSVVPILDGGDHPDFTVRAENGRGEYVEFLASSYGHARSYIERPLLNDLTRTHWTYNEYMIRTDNLRGRIDGDVVDSSSMGQGFGTLEYSWGLGI